MTDITELAQSLKAAADREMISRDLGETSSIWQDSVTPDNILALVEALELKEEQRANWFQMAQKLGEDFDAAEKRYAESESSGIAPGILRCSECSFVLTKNIISITADTITTGNSEPEPCPNGCGLLQPVTWKALAIQLMFTTKKGVADLLEAKKRNAELESFRTAYMEWSDKTDWVNTDRRFGVVKPLGKHRADVLKAYIEHLESRTVTVKLPAKIERNDADASDINQPGMVVAVHIDAGDFVKIKDQVFEVEETDFDDHDVTLWFVGGEALKCAAGCQIEVVTAPEEAE